MMNYLCVTYDPVSLFSLKRSDATSMAARSNLVPTPYAIKMALLRVWIEYYAQQSEPLERQIRAPFQRIRDLHIEILPPHRITVNRNGYKLRYYDQTEDKTNKTHRSLPLQGGFVFREWLYYQGSLQICCQSEAAIADLADSFALINYFGKRGCFFQYLPDRVTYGSQPPEWWQCASDAALVQPMDDLGSKTTFKKIDPFSTQRAKLGSDRIVPQQFLPLRLVASGARYDLYERTEFCEE